MPNDHTILSLDLGNNLGWAKVVNGVIVQSGVVSLFRKDAHPGDRFLRFSNWLRTHKGLNEIFYEDVPRFESNSLRGSIAACYRSFKSSAWSPR
jgi:hypothetical protein